MGSGTTGLTMPSYPWNHPTGWFRHDVYERAAAYDTNFSYVSLDVLRARHLDVYDVTLGVVEPDEAAAFSIIPNSQLASRLCSAYNDWLLERWLQEEPRLRGMLVVPAQYPEAAAAEVRRVGGRDEFVGVFLPGGARIPYGNPVYDPLWEAVNELGLPVAVHTHYESVGIGSSITAAGTPDYYVEYHTLCGSGMYGHFVSILCHGIFERFPNTRVAMVEGGLVPVRRVPLAPRHQLEGMSERDPVVQAPSVGVRLGSRALRVAAARVARRPGAAARCDRVPAAVGHAHVRERLPALGLRRAGADASPASGRVA